MRTALATPPVDSLPRCTPAADNTLLLIAPDACRLFTVVSFKFAAVSERVKAGDAKSPKIIVLAVSRMLRAADEF